MEDIKELSALDLHYLLKEFELLKDSKVENIYQNKGTLYLVLHVSGTGKRILKIMLPSFIYMTEYKEEMPEKPPQFCSLMRKYLKNTRFRSIEQIDFERIIKITFTSKDQTYYLVVELFSKGNIILCNSNMKIIYPMTHQKWKDRTIKGGQQYIHPEKSINILQAKKEDLEKAINATKLDSVVTFLAKYIGFGGSYAEEICKEGKINKKNTPKKVNSSELMKQISKILNKKIKLNKNLDKTLTEKTITQEKESKEKTFKDNKTKIQKILDMQKESIEKQKKTIKEGNEKGDLIYKHYNEVRDIITELSLIRKKHSWKEIKEKLKKHKVIKDINEKTGKITLELEQ